VGTPVGGDRGDQCREGDRITRQRLDHDVLARARLHGVPSDLGDRHVAANDHRARQHRRSRVAVVGREKDGVLERAALAYMELDPPGFQRVRQRHDAERADGQIHAAAR
jgi:hypothetical protein